MKLFVPKIDFLTIKRFGTVDGWFGTVNDLDGWTPASVWDVYIYKDHVNDGINNLQHQPFWKPPYVEDINVRRNMEVSWFNLVWSYLLFFPSFGISLLILFLVPFPFFIYQKDLLFCFLETLAKKSRRHTNCDHWKVSACPLRSKDHLHSIRSKQTSQGFYITYHNGRTILDISVMTITEEKLQKLTWGSEILALKKIRTGTHIIFKTFWFVFWVLKILHQLGVWSMFFSICYVTTWLFPFNDSRSEWFLWGFQAGTSAEGGAWDTWIHERKRRRSDGRLKMDMVPKPWRLLCRGEFYWILLASQMAFFMWSRIRNKETRAAVWEPSCNLLGHSRSSPRSMGRSHPREIYNDIYIFTVICQE